VVRHQAIRPARHQSLAAARGEQIAIERVGAVLEDDRRAAVAPLGHVVREAGGEQAGEVRHAAKGSYARYPVMTAVGLRWCLALAMMARRPWRRIKGEVQCF
jgi:hypothetical protein